MMAIMVAAFLLGWIAGALWRYVKSRASRGNPDPRDARIRSLEADVRVAHTATEKAKKALTEGTTSLTETRAGLTEKETELVRQARTIEKLRADLRDSVMKTRELRAELADRASENLRLELRLREVETELSVAQASTSMLASGVLKYRQGDNDEDDEDVQASRTGR